MVYKMTKKNLKILDQEDKRTEGKVPYVRFQTESEEYGMKWMSCFDAKEAEKVPFINQTVKGGNYNYKKFYDDETIKLVGERYQKDLELFRYKF